MQDKYGMQIRNNVVAKPNTLIQKSRYNLSLQQQKILLSVISMINPNDEDFKDYVFDIPAFCRICGFGEIGGRNYQMLRESIQALSDASWWFTDSDGKRMLFRWISEAEVDPKTNKLILRLHRHLKPYLLQLKECFTKYEMIWILRLKSKYTIRLYELIKSIHYSELQEYSKDYTLDELKELLSAENYRTFQHFKERVLEPAILEINKYSDKNVEYLPLKRGRGIFGVRLMITTKDSFEQCKLRSDINKELGGLDGKTLWDELLEKGLVSE